MKRMLAASFAVIATLFSSLSGAQAETLVYPFDAITIVSATAFDAEVPAGLPSGSRFAALPAGSLLHVYMGEIVLHGIGDAADSESHVLIVTDAAGADLFRFVINHYSLDEKVSRTWSFASHITIDPKVGVVKDGAQSDGFFSFHVRESLVDGGWVFLDEHGAVFATVPGTIRTRTGLDETISVNETGGTAP